MNDLEMDGMTIDQVIYYWDQPVIYLGRIKDGDDRPCLVVLVEDSTSNQIYHRLRFADERGMRATLASGCSPTPATYALAQDLARLVVINGDEEWTSSTRDDLIAKDGPPTSLPPGRSTGDIEMSRWGVDHWTLLLYLAGRQEVAGSGPATVEYHRLRINPQSHAVQACGEWSGTADGWSGESGTRCASYDDDPDAVPAASPEERKTLQVTYHDDFDCLEEMEAEGLLDILSTAQGTFSMTKAGVDLARRAAHHLARNGTLVGFRSGDGVDNTPVSS